MIISTMSSTLKSSFQKAEKLHVTDVNFFEPKKAFIMYFSLICPHYLLILDSWQVSKAGVNELWIFFLEIRSWV